MPTAINILACSSLNLNLINGLGLRFISFAIFISRKSSRLFPCMFFTTDSLYVRFIGDRSVQEMDFGRIQIDRIAEMQKWAENIKNVRAYEPCNRSSEQSLCWIWSWYREYI